MAAEARRNSASQICRWPQRKRNLGAWSLGEVAQWSTFRNPKIWIWILAPAFASCETWAKCSTSESVYSYVELICNPEATGWLWRLNTHTPGKMPTRDSHSLPSPAPNALQILSGEQNPLTHFHNPFRLLRVKSFLFNLKTFSSHLNCSHDVLFSKEIKVYLQLSLSECCYQIPRVLETSKTNSKRPWDLDRI